MERTVSRPMLHRPQLKETIDAPSSHSQVNEREGAHRVSHAQSQGLVNVVTSSHALHKK
jgi:hypothetical protein